MSLCESKLPIIAGLILALSIFIPMTDVLKAHADEPPSPFPEIKGKFGSGAQGYEMNGDFIDYGSKVRITFNNGTLYRRPGGGYDYFFLGGGRMDIIDTLNLGINWSRQFGGEAGVEFVSAYICGRDFDRYLMLDSARWRDAKIRRPAWQKLQFMVSAPDRYFWIDLSGELGLWPQEREPMPPLWVSMELANGNQVVASLSPEVSEQLSLYYNEKQVGRPYLLADFDLSPILKLSPIEIDSTVIAIDLEESGKFDAECEIYFAPGTDTRGVRFSLPNLFTVDSVFDAVGAKLPYIKDKERANFYLGPRPEVIDRPDNVTVYYQGKFLNTRYAGVDFPINITRWFPHLQQRSLGSFTVQYTLHKDLTLLSVGDKVKDTVVGDRRTVTYKSGDISYVSFASGLYDTLSEVVRDIPITMFIRRQNNQGIFNRAFPQTVMDDLTGSFRSFYDWFGPPLTHSLEIVDQPLSTGQSSPGLIHLAGFSFETNRNQARFRSHEMAHQWWGHTVIPKTFKDIWLSEGLAEMSAALYLLNAKHDTTEYRELTAHWRRQVLEEGKIGGFYSRGYRAGPILMGSRLLFSFSPGDYIALVYFKAAYMLEMLRFEIDGPEYRTDFFSNMLAEFRRTYYARQATTMDFIRVADNYIGDRRAAGFFKQWLFDWKVPEFDCHYAIRPDTKGRPMLEINIEVSGVEADFETPYPVEVEFENGTKRLFRIDGVGHQKEHILGPFPEKIKNVRFDPDHIILSRDTKTTRIG